MNQALGLLEVKGLLGAITVADVMVKASNIHVVDIDRAKGFGWFAVKIVGDVGAVQSAIEAGKYAADDMGLFVAMKVIPRVSQSVVDVFLQADTKESEEPIVVEEEPILEATTESVEVVTEEPTPVDVNDTSLEVAPVVETVAVPTVETVETPVVVEPKKETKKGKKSSKSSKK